MYPSYPNHYLYHGYLYYPALHERVYPQVNVTLFKQSAQSMKNLLRETTLLVNKLSDSPGFAYQVMNAAQQANQKEVERLIKSAGVTSKATISFNPDSIHLELSSKTGSTNCCHLTVALRWQ
ncbi:hypothetical protein [Bacillus sp. REN10]|uniref:hypothetical protein n=1 Tax=Bacillus sp. REN10 TaxID=2782541 RepID=UPI00193B8799|nr:hypothetical protein [Bacillus sp. REN10]